MVGVVVRSEAGLDTGGEAPRFNTGNAASSPSGVDVRLRTASFGTQPGLVSLGDTRPTVAIGSGCSVSVV